MQRLRDLSAAVLLLASNLMIEEVIWLRQSYDLRYSRTEIILCLRKIFNLQQCTMQQGLPFERKKKYHEMFNFENRFLYQFSSNTWFFFGGGSLNNPRIGKRKKEFTNINLSGCKTQKTGRGGGLSRRKRASKFSCYAMLWYLLL